MKKILFVFATVLLLGKLAVAQVTLQLSVPATGMIQKNQLWNVLVVNSTNKQYDCRLEMVLRDRITGQEVMTATTGQFTIAAGSKQLNATILSPVQYNDVLSGQDNRLQGLLPAGSYTACYALSSTTLKEANLAEECISFDAEPLSPPMLIFPADSAELDNAPTQLSWTPPTPEGMFDRLHYEIAITEIKDGQKATEAIQENLPFYTGGTLYTNMMNYPGTATSFEKDKWYAWQVVARDDRNYAGKSEVWVFKIKGIAKQTIAGGDAYVFINDNGAGKGTIYLDKRELLLKYYSFSNDPSAKISITNMDGQEVQSIKQPVQYGDNYCTVNLAGAVQPNKPYRAVIKDKNGKEYSILFSISK